MFLIPMLGDEQSLGVDIVFITIKSFALCKEYFPHFDVVVALAIIATTFGV